MESRTSRDTAWPHADRSDGYGTIRLYLRTIGQLKSLAPRQEIRLAARVRKGDIAAREELLKGCLPLVVTVAQGYSNRGLTLLDLVSEGNLGLIQAVQHFDPAKSDKLSTFSSGWIKRSIESALDTVPRTSRIAA